MSAMSHDFFARGGANGNADDQSDEELQRLLSEGVPSLPEPVAADTAAPTVRKEEADEEREDEQDSYLQSALALFAEASQDMATAALELNMGRHFACVDYCNQVAEKAAQAVSLRRFGRRSSYDHDLRALGAVVGAPIQIQEKMESLTPFHPEAFYADTPPEEADEVISAEQAAAYVQSTRDILRWARGIILHIV